MESKYRKLSDQETVSRIKNTDRIILNVNGLIGQATVDEVVNASSLKSQITTPFKFKGSCEYASLPSSGNTVNDTYYVTDKNRNYTWNGSAWYVSSADMTELNNGLKGLTPIVDTVTIESGEPTTVTDSIEMPLQGMKVYGKSEQTVTTGAQLFYDFPDNGTLISDGEFLNHYSVKANLLGNYAYYVNVDLYEKSVINKIRVATDKKLVLKVDQDPSYKLSAIFYSDNGNSYDAEISEQGNKIVVDLSTITNIEKLDILQLRFLRTDTNRIDTTSVAKNIMLYLSNTGDDIPFEPYSGGVASPSPEYPQPIKSVGDEDNITVNITSKNLFNMNDSSNLLRCSVYHGHISNVDLTAQPILKIDGLTVGKQYTISYRHEAMTVHVCGEYSVLYSIMKSNTMRDAVGNSETILQKYGDGHKVQYVKATFTAPVSTVYFVGTTVKENIYDFQIEEGTEASPYEDYHKSTATIPLSSALAGIPVSTGGNYTDENGQQYICDEIDFKRGKYVQRVWTKTLDGSEEWNDNGYRNAFFCSILPENMNFREGLCNQFKVGTDYDATEGTCIRFGSGADGNIYTYYNPYYDASVSGQGVSQWKAHLASNPLVVMTHLYKPIETSLTESQLQTYASLTTFKPSSIISNDEGGRMDVSYVCDAKAYIDKKLASN